MKVLSIDPGFAETKIAYKFSTTDFIYFKELNLIAKIKGEVPEGIKIDNNENVVEFNGELYYVGGGASQFPQSNLVNIVDYDSLLKIAPLLVKKSINKYGEFDYLIVDLSIAYINRSAEFKKYLIESLGLDADKVFVVPQGIGCKLALDNIGLDISNPSEKIIVNNYLGVDIGFNTVDVFRVINKKLSSADIKGYEGKGAIRICSNIQNLFKTKYSIDLSVSIAKKILTTGTYYSRGIDYDIREDLKNFKKSYIEELHKFLEENYSESLNQIDHLILFGGGAEIIKEVKDTWNKYYSDGFVLIPTFGSEYYNSVGNIFAIDKLINV